MNELSREKTMTVKDVAEALSMSYDTIMQKARELGYTKNGITTYLSELQVTKIKELIVPRTFELKSKVESTTTELDRQKTIILAMQYLKEDYDKMKQRAEIAEQKCIEQQPKVDFAERVIQDEHSTFDMAHVAQELKLPYGKIILFARLRELKILKDDNTPYQIYCDRGYFKVYPVSTPVGTKLTTKVTQKGIDFIRKNILEVK